MRNNSIFQYESTCMVCDKTYQKGCNMPFRMNIGEKVFNFFRIESLELIKNGTMLYHLSMIPLTVYKEPEEEGFVLINQKDFKDVNIRATPHRTLHLEQTFAPDLTK